MEKYSDSCYINSMYSLLQFLILCNKNEREKTFYFFGRAISKDVVKLFKNSQHFNIYFKNENKFTKYIKMYFLYRNLEKFIIKEDLINKKMYLQDSVSSYSQFFLNHMNDCYLIEDGLGTYKLREEKKKLQIKRIRDKILKRYSIYYENPILSNKIKKVYLTGIAEIPNLIKDKVEIINLKEKWEQLSFEEQEEILRIFDLKNSDLIKWQKLENRILLITQPLSEDGIISEKEKIEIYKEIVEKNKSESIMIKSHPREKTNYKNIFPNMELIEGKFPLEILILLGINFKEVITIFSTAALNFKGITNVNFIGTENNEHLKEKVGEIKKVYYKI